MYQINTRSLVQNKLLLAKNYHLQPSEIDKLQYYEWEAYLEEVNILEKKYQAEQEKQQEEQKAAFNPNSFNTQMAQMQRSMASTTFGSGNFKAPTMPSMPKMSVPKFN